MERKINSGFICKIFYGVPSMVFSDNTDVNAKLTAEVISTFFIINNSPYTFRCKRLCVS